MTPEKINLAREWLAGFVPVADQGVLDTIEEALELAMEKALRDQLDEAALSDHR